MSFNSHNQPLITIIFTLLGLIFSTNAGAAKIKCWTNDEGVRECGESVPPEYSQQGHKELNESGIVVDKKDRALTEEEIAEKRRQEERQAEVERERTKQRRADTELLQTFSSEADIIRARDDKVSAMNAQITLAESRNEKLQEDLDKRMETAAAQERAGKEPPQALLKDIENLRRQIQTNDEFIAKTKAKRERIREEYSADLQRFRELKQGGGTAAVD